MLLYLDTSNLFDLCDDKAPVKISELAQKLRAGAHKIVFSLDTLIEVAAPLFQGDLLDVRKAMNQLEELPHTFINEARIRYQEIRETVSAFEEHREYRFEAVSPLCSRIDDAIDVRGYSQYMVQAIGNMRVRVASKMIVNLGIWDAIYYIWRADPEAFRVQHRREPEWIAVLEADSCSRKDAKLRRPLRSRDD
jgi:hypothetical protein